MSNNKKYGSKFDNIYCYKDTNILINKFNIKDEKLLQNIEQDITSDKMFKIDSYPKGSFDFKHLKELHKYLFGDLYDFAGEVRKITISKNGTKFCNPLYAESAFNDLESTFKKDNYLNNVHKKDLHKTLAYYYSELNAIHAFREGNGRTNRAFLNNMLYQSKHNIILDYKNIDKDKWIEASVESFTSSNTKLEAIYKKLVTKAFISKNKILFKERNNMDL